MSVGTVLWAAVLRWHPDGRFLSGSQCLRGAMCAGDGTRWAKAGVLPREFGGHFLLEPDTKYITFHE